MKRLRPLWFLLALAILSACQSQRPAEAQTTSSGADSDIESETVRDKPDVGPAAVDASDIFSKTGPKTIVRNVLQDSSGGFWLATFKGLFRFDGSTFTNVTRKEGLRPCRIFCVLEDHQGNIWVGTIGEGVYRYDGKTFTNYTAKDGLVSNNIFSMMQDSDKNIWFGGMGVTKYDGTTFTSFAKKEGFTSSDVNSISQAPDGKIWFGTRGALFHYNGEKFVTFSDGHTGYVPTLMDRKGHLWFGGMDGIYHYDGEKVRHVFEPSSYSLMEDSHGNIWFSGGASNDGSSVINRFAPAAGLENVFSARKQFDVKDRGIIFGLTEDKDGNIWFGTAPGIGRIEGDMVRHY